MAETETPHFHDLVTLGRFPEPQNQLSLSFETIGYLKQSKKNSTHCWKYCCYKYHNFENPKLRTYWNRQAPNNHKDPSEHFLKILIMRSISSRKYEMGFFGNIEPIYFLAIFQPQWSRTKHHPDTHHPAPTHPKRNTAETRDESRRAKTHSLRNARQSGRSYPWEKPGMKKQIHPRQKPAPVNHLL